jgi:transcriptional regulator GlxA family with amidase domain
MGALRPAMGSYHQIHQIAHLSLLLPVAAKKAVENLRIEAARLMMEQSRHPIDVIARQTGFADRDRMRRAFLRALGQPPQVIRRNARVEGTA